MFLLSCPNSNFGKVIPKFYSDKVFKYDIRELLEIEPGIIFIGTHGQGIFIHDVRKKTFEKIRFILNDVWKKKVSIGK